MSDTGSGLRLAWPIGNIPVIVSSPYRAKNTSSFKKGRIGLFEHDCYLKASREIDKWRAHTLVKKFMTRSFLSDVNKLVRRSRKSRKVVLIAPDKDESTNAIPRALSEELSTQFNLEIDGVIKEVSAPRRAQMTAWEKLYHQPKFYGKVYDNRVYLGVDDMISTGSTMTAMRNHVSLNGGIFAGAICIASPDGRNTRLNVNERDVRNLRAKYDKDVIEWFEKSVGFGFSELALGEADLLRRPDVVEMINSKAGSNCRCNNEVICRDRQFFPAYC